MVEENEYSDDVPRRMIRTLGGEDIEGQPIVKYTWVNEDGVDDPVYMSIQTAIHMWNELGKSLMVLQDAGWIVIEMDEDTPEGEIGEAASGG